MSLTEITSGGGSGMPAEAAGPTSERYDPDAERRHRRVRLTGWITGISLVSVIGTTLLLLALNAPGLALDPRSQAPLGGRALVEVLRSEGIDVQITGTYEDTLAALPGSDILVLSDPEGWLFNTDLAELDRTTARMHVILIDPYGAPQQTFAPLVDYAGTSQEEEALDTHCTLPAAVNAETVQAPIVTLFRAAGEAEICFRESDGSSSGALVQFEDGPRTVAVLGPELFSNDRIDEAGNAALGLWLLGSGDRVVWYQPSSADAAPPELGTPPIISPPDYRPPRGGGAAESPLAPFLPSWLLPSMILLALVTAAAALWRGRRLGPLVTENLPVTPRANETMEGRALLYRRSRARLRSLDALRIGALRRMAPRLGLPRSASVDEIASALSSLLAIDRSELLQLLRDRQPVTDAGLVQDSDALLRLENHLAARLSAGDAPGRMNNR